VTVIEDWEARQVMGTEAIRQGMGRSLEAAAEFASRLV
jgi:hypothetical protein